MKVLSIGKNIIWLFLLFVMEQLVSVPQIVASSLPVNNLALVILIAMYIALAVAVMIFMIQFYRHKIKVNHSRFGLHRLNKSRALFMLLMIVIWVGLLFFEAWYAKNVSIKSPANEQVIDNLYHHLPIWTMLDGAFLAPIMEELIFRGIFFELFFQSPHTIVKIIGIIVNGALFGALHDVGISFPIYAIMGILLAITYQYTKDVRYGMFIHILNNFVAFL